MCRNALSRSVARPLSDARNRRTLTAYAVTGGQQHRHGRRPDVAPDHAGVRARPLRAARGRSSAGPRSGTTTRPAVVTAARARVTQMPLRISGESSRPRRRVSHVPRCERGLDRRAHRRHLLVRGDRGPFRGLPGVGRDETLVALAPPEELGVGAVVDDAAPLEVDDVVGEGDRRHPVGDHQHGGPRAGVAQRRPGSPAPPTGRRRSSRRRGPSSWGRRITARARAIRCR